MKLPDSIAVGVDTHTGRVRTSNEDDYLLLGPLAAHDADNARPQVLLVVADGMGGVTGGAEASRAAVRALSVAYLLDDDAEDPEQRLARGFGRACERVVELSREQPRLRDMGTTLTVLNLLPDDTAVLGHVGDSRCYRLRDGVLEQLSVDHAVRGVEHRLTRCIGGGRETEEVDLQRFALRPGDAFLLATDGLWDEVTDAEIRAALAQRDAQAGAERLVQIALERGGPDNCTAVVARLGDAGGALVARQLVDTELPAREMARTLRFDGPVTSLRRERWPWAVLGLAVVLAALALARLVFGWNPLL